MMLGTCCGQLGKSPRGREVRQKLPTPALLGTGTAWTVGKGRRSWEGRRLSRDVPRQLMVSGSPVPGRRQGPETSHGTNRAKETPKPVLASGQEGKRWLRRSLLLLHLTSRAG